MATWRSSNRAKSRRSRCAYRRRFRRYTHKCHSLHTHSQAHTHARAHTQPRTLTRTHSRARALTRARTAHPFMTRGCAGTRCSQCTARLGRQRAAHGGGCRRDREGCAPARSPGELPRRIGPVNQVRCSAALCTAHSDRPQRPCFSMRVRAWMSVKCTHAII
jgi:hypothetical protein